MTHLPSATITLHTTTSSGLALVLQATRELDSKPPACLGLLYGICQATLQATSRLLPSNAQLQGQSSQRMQISVQAHNFPYTCTVISMRTFAATLMHGRHCNTHLSARGTDAMFKLLHGQPSSATLSIDHLACTTRAYRPMIVSKGQPSQHPSGLPITRPSSSVLQETCAPLSSPPMSPPCPE